MNLPLIDLVVLVLYVAGVVGLGCWFVRKSGRTDEFMAAGRAVPGWAVGLSILGTYVSSISFLANPGKSFSADWSPLVFALSLPLAAWIATTFFVPYYRRGGHISAYSRLEERFGPWARTYAAVCYLLMQIARVGTIMYLVALALAPLIGWNVKGIIIVTGVLVTLYTLLGGIEAVIWTDVVQSIVLIGGALVCTVLLLVDMPGGPEHLFSVAAEREKFSLGSFRFVFTSRTFWVILIYGLAINLKNFGIDQSYVQRYLTARSDRDAARSVWLGALIYVPVSALFLFIGTALFSYYSAQPDLLPEAMGTIKGDEVFPHFIATELPPGVSGLLIAAIFAAAMSSVDSSLNCSATLTLSDIYRRYLRPDAGERESMRVLYGATVFWGVVGTGVALAMTQVRSALDAWWELTGIFSGGMLGLFLLGMISRTTRNAGAVTGVIVGVLVIGWMTFSDLLTGPLRFLRSPFHSFMTIVVGTLTILLVGMLAEEAGRRLRGRGVATPGAHSGASSG